LRSSHDLQLHGLAIELDCANFLGQICQPNCPCAFVRLVCLAKVTYEVNADCGNVRFCVGVVGESEQQARLSNTAVSDEKQLEEVVVSESSGQSEMKRLPRIALNMY
jgi:hypothetical protein